MIHNLVNEVFASLYEQIERTLVTPWTQLIAAVVLILIAVFCIVALVQSRVSLGYAQLSNRDLETLAALAENAHDTDSRVNFLYEFKHLELAAMNDLRHGPGVGGATLVIIIIAMVVCIALLSYLVAVCYPGAVFAWGDYGEYYAALVARRKAIWRWFVGTLLGGILVSLLVTSLQKSVFH